eukprot:14634344-Heterocapsa_arctica.AAC.1
MQKAGIGAQAPSPWMASIASLVTRGPPKPASCSLTQLFQMKSASSFVRSCSKLLMRRCEDSRNCSLEVASSPASSILAKIS